MKTTIISLLIFFAFGCKDKKDESDKLLNTQLASYNAQKRADSIADAERVKICEQRGHLYTPVKNTTVESEYISGVSISYNGYYSPNTDTVLVDTPDSSYLIREVPSEWKLCYRCRKRIEFKKSSVYVKTIWKK